MKRVLVVAVHPDDETLACGGTLLKHRHSGDKIFWLIVTSMSPGKCCSQAQLSKRDGQIAKVANLYKFSGVYRLNFPAAELCRVNHGLLVRDIASIFNQVKPSVVYLPFKNDIHSDHRIVFDAAYNCTKTFRYPWIKKVLAVETISETECAFCHGKAVFKPDVFSDISGFLEKKIEIMKVYKGEMHKHPFPRSAKNIEALATFRGSMAGYKYAEAFMLLKERW